MAYNFTDKELFPVFFKFQILKKYNLTDLLKPK